MGIFSSDQRTTEPKMVKVVPKDMWALTERKRREASERALSVANMLADRFGGVVEPIEAPLEPGETPINAGMPRTYRVNTGNTRIYVHIEVRGVYDIHCPAEEYNTASDEEMRDIEDSVAGMKIRLSFIYRYFKPSDESFYWESDYSTYWSDTCKDEDEINEVVSKKVVMW